MATFGYRGDMAPCCWGKLKPEWNVADNGKRQSPINVSTSNVTVSENIPNLKYNWNNDNNVKLVNNGHSPTWNVTPGTHTLDGGPLNGQYELAQFHIHFACDMNHGCEHTVDGKSHPAEIHFVHFKKSYGSLGEAVRHGDGLAVVGAFIDVDDNRAQPKICDDLKKLTDVTSSSSEVNSLKIDLADYMLNTDRFYTYNGSLTTPGCAECVVWILLQDSLFITKQAYETMCKLESVEGGLLASPGNYRPVQPLHGRTVMASFDPAHKTAIPYN